MSCDTLSLHDALPSLMLAKAARETFGTDWGIGETGAAGPTGNRYGDAAGHTCIAISGPIEHVITLETGDDDRERNMWAFAEAVLELLAKGVNATGSWAAVAAEPNPPHGKGRTHGSIETHDPPRPAP